MRFVHNLLPQLRAAPSARIVSVHMAGWEGRLNEDDLLLKDTYSVPAGGRHSATMNTLFLREISRKEPTISCLHTFPSLVITPAYEKRHADWWLPFRLFVEWVVVPVFRLLAVSAKESGERNLFHATSAKYPPAGESEPPEAGVALPKGMEKAKGSDGKVGTGCYVLNWNGEEIGNWKLIDDLVAKGNDKLVWEHTFEVWNARGIDTS